MCGRQERCTKLELFQFFMGTQTSAAHARRVNGPYHGHSLLLPSNKTQTEAIIYCARERERERGGEREGERGPAGKNLFVSKILQIC